jgi:hypothetical protein
MAHTFCINHSKSVSLSRVRVRNWEGLEDLHFDKSSINCGKSVSLGRVRVRDWEGSVDLQILIHS